MQLWQIVTSEKFEELVKTLVEENRRWHDEFFERLDAHLKSEENPVLYSPPVEPPNPWEDGTIYKLAREWVVANPDKRATHIIQTRYNTVWLFSTFVHGPNTFKEWKYSTFSLGDFPEHPNGWSNSFTPLPPVPRVEEWPDDAESFVIDAHVQYMPPELNVYYKMYPRDLMDVWQFTRDEMEGKQCNSGK